FACPPATECRRQTAASHSDSVSRSRWSGSVRSHSGSASCCRQRPSCRSFRCCPGPWSTVHWSLPSPDPCPSDSPSRSSLPSDLPCRSSSFSGFPCRRLSSHPCRMSLARSSNVPAWSGRSCDSCPAGLAAEPELFARARQLPGRLFPTCSCSGYRRRPAISPRVKPKMCRVAQRRRRRFRWCPLASLARKPGQRRPSAQRFRAEVSYSSWCVSSLVLSGLFQERRAPSTRQARPDPDWRENRCDDDYVPLFVTPDRAVILVAVKTSFAQLSATARFTDSLSSAGTELRFPCWPSVVQHRERNSGVHHGPS